MAIILINNHNFVLYKGIDKTKKKLANIDCFYNKHSHFV